MQIKKLNNVATGFFGYIMKKFLGSFICEEKKFSSENSKNVRQIKRPRGKTLTSDTVIL